MKAIAIQENPAASAAVMDDSGKNYEVVQFNPYVNDRVETHLEYTVFYEAQDGRCRWSDGTLPWNRYQTADVLVGQVLKPQTEFVRRQWRRIEVCVPNRDQYGHLQSGWVKDIGLLLVTRPQEPRQQPAA